MANHSLWMLFGEGRKEGRQEGREEELRNLVDFVCAREITPENLNRDIA